MSEYNFGIGATSESKKLEIHIEHEDTKLKIKQSILITGPTPTFRNGSTSAKRSYKDGYKP